MDADVMRWRADTPATLYGRIHLNNAGAALMPKPVVEAITDHIERETVVGGYEAADAASELVAASYEAVADLVGAAPRNIAVVENATAAFAQALSAFDFQRGDAIVTTRADYVSNQLMYLSLARRQGVEVVRADDLPDGGVDPDSVRSLIRERRPRIVAMSWVPTNSGLVQPAAAVGEICEREDVPFVLDACQAVGQIPVDVARLRCDFLAATARKFLRGPRGVGFLYVSDRALDRGLAPLYIDMRGARWTEADAFEPAGDARRFENWEFPYALLIGMGEAAGYALEVGVDEGGRRAAGLAAYARSALAGTGRVRVLDRGPELCAIVTAEIAGRDARDVVRELRAHGINTGATLREVAVLDMDDKRAETAIRISPHYFNTRAEIDTVVQAIADLA